MSGRAHLLVGRVVLAGFFLALSVVPASPAADSVSDGIRSYWDLLKAGETEKALECAEEVLSDLQAAHGDLPVHAVLGGKLRAVRSAAKLAVYKTTLISPETSGRSSAFAYVAPSPGEFFASVDGARRVLVIDFAALPDEGQRAFAESVVATALLQGDRAVCDAYGPLFGEGREKGAVSKLRAYLTAYLIGVRDEAALPDAIAAVGRSLTGGQAPYFLVEDMVHEIGDAQAAYHLLGILSESRWAGWSKGEEIRLLKALGEAGAQKGDNSLAIAACWKAAGLADGQEAQEILYHVVSLYAERAKKIRTLPAKERAGGAFAQEFRDATNACDEYLDSFPKGAHADGVRFAKAFFEVLSGDYERALEDAKSLRQANPRSYTAAKLMIIEGTAALRLERADEAIGLFLKAAEGFPGTPAAGRALYMAGQVYLKRGNMKEAVECFQKVADFYPGIPFSKTAEMFLRRYAAQEEDKTQ